MGNSHLSSDSSNDSSMSELISLLLCNDVCRSRIIQVCVMVADRETRTQIIGMVADTVEGNSRKYCHPNRFGYEFRNIHSSNYYRQFLHPVVCERTYVESRIKDSIFRSAF